MNRKLVLSMVETAMPELSTLKYTDNKKYCEAICAADKLISRYRIGKSIVELAEFHIGITYEKAEGFSYDRIGLYCHTEIFKNGYLWINGAKVGKIFDEFSIVHIVERPAPVIFTEWGDYLEGKILAQQEWE